jgi:hypothetical protein
LPSEGCAGWAVARPALALPSASNIVDRIIAQLRELSVARLPLLQRMNLIVGEVGFGEALQLGQQVRIADKGDVVERHGPDANSFDAKWPCAITK